MTWDTCNAHVSTNLEAPPRGFTLCATRLPPWATSCHTCGTAAPRTRIERWWQNFIRQAVHEGDVEAAVLKGRGRTRAERRARP